MKTPQLHLLPVAIVLVWSPPWGQPPTEWPPLNLTLYKDAVLFLRLDPRRLPEVEEAMRALGFTWKTMAFTVAREALQVPDCGAACGSTPMLLIGLGIRGKPKRVDAGVHQVIELKGRPAQRTVAEEIIRLMGKLPAVVVWPETRRAPPGWASLYAPMEAAA